MKVLPMLRWPLTLILPFIVYFAAPADISPKAPLFMAMTSMAVLAWAFNVFPAIGVAALLTFGYVLGNVAPMEVIFGPWATVLPGFPLPRWSSARPWTKQVSPDAWR